MRLPRRLTFQLVSLFDLLIIIVFAQYFDLQGRLKAEREKDREVYQTEANELAELKSQFEKILELQAEKSAEASDTQDRLDQEHQSLVKLSQLVAKVLRLKEPALSELLSPRTPDERARVREALERLEQSGGAEALRQILTLAELEKRCDLWQLHVEANGLCRVIAGGREITLRTDNSEKFATDLFKHARTLPEPKSLVMVLLTWDNARRRSWENAQSGMESTIDKLRDEGQRRTRFESAILGYLPRSLAAE